jgi:midasin
MLLNDVCLPSWRDRSSSFEGEFINTEMQIGVHPFVLDKKVGTTSSQFAFDAKTTKSNLHRLLRAHQLQKPTLIEGPPGVGKTSLVENLARISGRLLTRVNLSEQTDMMDLLGSEYPTTNDNGGPESGDGEDIQFRWCDGALLRAIKEGHWFLIDEMNLAQ